MIDKEFLNRVLVDLIHIDSANPSLVPGSPGEAELGAYLAQLMETSGLQVFIHTLAPQRLNVVGILRGSGGGKSLLLNAHMDTVGFEGMTAPLSGKIQNGRVYGRGSQDMKGGLAAMLAAALAVKSLAVPLRGDLIIACVADEEYASLGTADLVRHYHADAAIVTEPTDLVIGLAHRGFIWFEVETTGRAAHGSRYTEGIDAIMHMGRFLSGLERLEKELLQRPPHPFAGPPSLHTSTIQGGSEWSIYPAKCRLAIERRTVPGETVQFATAELEQMLDQLRMEDSQFDASLHPALWRSPFEIDPKEEIVRLVEQALSRQLKQQPRHGGASFWTDAALLAEAGIPSLLLGPAGAGLHSAEEWVDLQSTFDLAEILVQTTLEFCK
jgi:acetylornithine deacetylase